MPPEALLAIRSDIAHAVEQEYLEWLTEEHTLERVAIDGFISARILRSKHVGFGRYLILYELEEAGVVDSTAYLERLNNPTPWTTQMMPHLGNFVRGGGNIITSLGAGCGGVLVPIMTKLEICVDEIKAIEAVSKAPGIVALRVLQTDSQRTTVASNERKMRSGDQSFDTLLIVEALDEETASRTTQQLPPRLLYAASQYSLTDGFSVYSQIFYLRRCGR